MRFWPRLGGLGPHRAVAFFGLCYLYVWLQIRPYLIFHVQEPVFFSGWSYLNGFLQIPGGISAYAAAYAGQSYVIDWLGALVITLVMACIGLCCRGYVRRVAGRRLDLFAFAPAVILLILHNRYHYDLAFDLSLLTAIAAATVSARLDQKRRLWWFVLGSPFIYWIAGGAWLLFALLCAIREWLDKRPVEAVVYAAVGAILPWLATWTVYPGTLENAYLHLLPISGPYLHGSSPFMAVALILYLFVPVTALLAAYIPPGKRSGRVAWNTSRVLLVGIGGWLVIASMDSNHRTMLEIDHQARQRNWKAVLSLVPELSAYDVLTVYNVQLALCHTGRMGKDLFSYPHQINAPIFVPSPDSPARLLALGDNLTDMGYINKAEHMLQEAVEIQGDRPSLLRRLVMVNVLKNRPSAARVYLGQLLRSPLDHAWASDYLRALDVDPRRADDVEIRRLREVMLETDYPGFFSPEDIMRQLLERNPNNMLAFDLLMGHYLQTAQPDKIVQNIRQLSQFPKAFPGTEIPRLYEEAVMLWATQVRLRTGAMPKLPLFGRSLSMSTQRRYSQFSQVLALHRDDPRRAKIELAKQHGDTFWYYYLYRGKETGVPVVSRATRHVQ